MKRWGLSKDRLPPGTIIRHRDPTLWEMYRWQITTAASLILLQAILIVGLLIQRSRLRKAEKGMVENKLLLQSTMDALNARVALVDNNGTIVAVNRRWASFSDENRRDGDTRDVGYNYFAHGAGVPSDETLMVANGMRRVMSGQVEDFRYVYQFPGPSETSWFQVRINRFDMEGKLRLVVTHEDVTEIKQAHDAQQHVTALLMRAQDEERRRIARDLHDVTVQNMVAIKAGLTGVRLAAHVLDDSESGEMLRESAALCDEVIRELRTLSYLLHPPLLDEAGLIPAIQWFVRGFMQRSGVQVELIAREDVGRLPEEVETALFRVVQESLTNIHRHAGSTSAMIWLKKEEDNVVLRVMDDGRGFSMTTETEAREGPLSFGVGIAGMRERLKQLGGELRIESGPKGTTVHARVLISEGRPYAYSSS
jgi:signal transduction histidine kinase